MGGGDAMSVAPGASAGGGREPSRLLGDMAMVLRDPAALHFMLHQVHPALRDCHLQQKQ